jgi:hypothetical protein
VRRYSLAECSKYHKEHVRLVKHGVPWYSVHENHMHMQRPDRRTQEYPQVPNIHPSARRDNRFASFEEQSYTTRAPREKKKYPSRNAPINASVIQHRSPTLEVLLVPTRALSTSVMFEQILEVGTRGASTGNRSSTWNIQAQGTRIALLMAVDAPRCTERRDTVAVIHG